MSFENTENRLFMYSKDASPMLERLSESSSARVYQEPRLVIVSSNLIASAIRAGISERELADRTDLIRTAMHNKSLDYTPRNVYVDKKKKGIYMVKVNPDTETKNSISRVSDIVQGKFPELQADQLAVQRKLTVATVGEYSIGKEILDDMNKILPFTLTFIGEPLRGAEPADEAIRDRLMSSPSLLDIIGAQNG